MYSIVFFPVLFKARGGVKNQKKPLNKMQIYFTIFSMLKLSTKGIRKVDFMAVVID